MVLLFHTEISYFDSAVSIIANSYLFVDLFFILSGFVMSHAYADKIKNGLHIKTYIALRLGRIYPLHLFMLLVFVCYTILKVYLHSLGFGPEQEFDKNNLHSFFSNLFLVHSLGIYDYLTWNTPSWSISVEFFTYILFFFLLKNIDRGSTLIIPFIIAISGYSFLFTLLITLEKGTLSIHYDYGFVRCVSAFYSGVFLYRAKKLVSVQNQYSNLLEIVALVFVVISLSCARLGWIYQALALVSFLVAISVYSRPDNGILGQLLHHPVMRYLGVWSYSIYMTHIFILSIAFVFAEYVLHIDLVKIHGPASLIVNFLLLVITILVSRFTYIYVEDKYRRLVKKRIHP